MVKNPPPVALSKMNREELLDYGNNVRGLNIDSAYNKKQIYAIVKQSVDMEKALESGDPEKIAKAAAPPKVDISDPWGGINYNLPLSEYPELQGPAFEARRNKIVLKCLERLPLKCILLSAYNLIWVRKEVTNIPTETFKSACRASPICPDEFIDEWDPMGFFRCPGWDMRKDLESYECLRMAKEGNRNLFRITPFGRAVAEELLRIDAGGAVPAPVPAPSSAPAPAGPSNHALAQAQALGGGGRGSGAGAGAGAAPSTPCKPFVITPLPDVSNFDLRRLLA